MPFVPVSLQTMKLYCCLPFADLAHLSSQLAAEPTSLPSAASTPTARPALRNSARRNPTSTPSSTARTSLHTRAPPPQWARASRKTASRTWTPWDPLAENRSSRHPRDMRRRRRKDVYSRRASMRAQHRSGVERAIGFREWTQSA